MTWMSRIINFSVEQSIDVESHMCLRPTKIPELMSHICFELLYAALESLFGPIHLHKEIFLVKDRQIS